MLVEDGLVVLDKSDNFLNSFVRIVFGEQCNLTQEFVMIHDDMNDAPMLNVVRLILNSILGNFHSLNTIVDILVDVFFEIGMGK